jgi:hypothetical protein
MRVRTKPLVKRFRLALTVFAGLVALEVAFLTFVDTTTRRLESAGARFQLRDIATGTLLAQRLEVAADGFDEVRLDGSITPGRNPALLHARLVEVNPDGMTLDVVRSTSLELTPFSSECCDIRFEPIPDSRWRHYRLDLAVGDLSGRRLSLWAVPSPIGGRLTINERPQGTYLVFRTKATEGTGFGRLRRASAGKMLSLAVLALICNASVAAMVHLLTTASDPRPA